MMTRGSENRHDQHQRGVRGNAGIRTLPGRDCEQGVVTEGVER